jgi:2-iminobutanoate/2-iminopropanoate deaminase
VQPVQLTTIDPQPHAYSHGALASGLTQLLFISGQVPETPFGQLPNGFDDQCRLAWSNVLTVLEKAGMTVRNLIKVTVFLSNRGFREANARIRHKILGEHNPALTVVITGIYEEAWLLEIEAIAAIYARQSL